MTDPIDLSRTAQAEKAAQHVGPGAFEAFDRDRGQVIAGGYDTDDDRQATAMTITQADSARALGMPPDDVEPVADLAPFHVLAGDLEVGDHIRDRGALHAITAFRRDDRLFDSMIIVMEDGEHLSVPLHQHVTVWREVPRG